MTEASVDSLSELFSRDPLKLQDQDIAKIVDELRKARASWAIAEASGAKRAPKESKPNLSLEDLEL